MFELFRRRRREKTVSARELRRKQAELQRKQYRKKQLREMPYNEYLRTKEWREKRMRVLLRDGYRCTKCGSSEQLNVHHLTYERRGAERYADLTTLCRRCHRKEHDL